MKLTIGYTAYHEVEMEAPPEIEEAYHKYQKMWADYEADPLNSVHGSSICGMLARNGNGCKLMNTSIAMIFW